MLTLSLITILLLVLTGCMGLQSDDHGGHCCDNFDGWSDTCTNWCFYDEEKLGYCQAKYVPGGNKIILEPIEAPTATLKDYSNAQIAANAGFISSLASDINDIVPVGVKKFSEQFAKGLGIFGSVISGIGSFAKPTPNDIIDACNKAIAELTDEVNSQFVNMQSYVDQSILQAQTDAIERFMTYFQSKFVNCFYEPTEQIFMGCLMDTERDIHASSVVFMGFKSKFNDSSYVPSDNEVKRMEMEFIIFMNYATLRTVNLLIMYDTYNNQVGLTADKQTCRFLTALQTELKEFVDYTKNMYNAIIQGHDQNSTYQYIIDNAERDWLQPEEYNDGMNWIYSQTFYQIRYSTMLPDSKDYYCTLSQKVRHQKPCGRDDCTTLYKSEWCNYGAENDDKGENGYMKSKCRSRDWGAEEYRKYTANMISSVENYWKPQTIDRMKPWTEILNQVEEKRNTKGCTAIENLDDDDNGVKSGRQDL